MLERRITPIEIEKTRFRKTFRGYSPKEVDQLLGQIISDYEAVLNDLSHLRQEINDTQKELAQYKTTESLLKEALMLAQKTADETRASAHKEADVIQQEANLRAEQLIDAARKHGDEIIAQTEQIKLERNRYFAEFKAMLNSYLSQIEHIENRENRNERINAVVLTQTETEEEAQEFEKQPESA